jgi:hypothetical protein
MVDKKDRFDFWVWQFAELIYHFAIWQYLAEVSGASFAIPAGAYAVCDSASNCRPDLVLPATYA